MKKIKQEKSPATNKLLSSYRKCCVSVRLNNEELSLLNERRGHHRKGEWLRMAFQHNLPPVIPPVNLEAWKTLGEVSQKLNKLVIHLDNKGNGSSLSKTELFAVKRQIAELRANLIATNMWSASMKGMQKIRRGKNFAGVVLYALRPGSHHRCTPYVIGGNMMGDATGDLIAEFDTTKMLRPNVAKPVWHNSLRLPKNEALTVAQWVAIADDYMKRMGFSETHLRCYVLHDDVDGQHIHIIASRIDLNAGKLYLGKNENLISTRIIQQLEEEHHLTRTKGPKSGAALSPTSSSSPSLSKKSPIQKPMGVIPKPKKLSRNEAMMEKYKEEPSPKSVIQEALETLLAGKPSTTEFVTQLVARNIRVVPNIASTGKMNGFSFEYQGIAFKASQLGKGYSWSALQNRLDYQPERDNDFLFSLKASVSEAPDVAITTATEITTEDVNDSIEALIQDNRAGQDEYAIVSKVVLSEADVSNREAYATEAVIEAGAGGKEAHATEAIKETHRKNTLSLGLTGFRWLETIPYLSTIIEVLRKLRIPILKRPGRHNTITGGKIIEITALTPKNTIQTTPKSHPSSFPM